MYTPSSKFRQLCTEILKPGYTLGEISCCNVLAVESFGALIERARLAAGMDPADLAARLGLKSRASIYAMESGQQMPSVKQINALVSVLPLSAEELLRAMGVNLIAPAASKIPKTLVDVLIQLEPEYQRHVEVAAQSVLLLQQSRQGRAK